MNGDWVTDAQAARDVVVISRSFEDRKSVVQTAVIVGAIVVSRWKMIRSDHS